MVEDNPQNVTYKAEFPEKPFSTVAIEGNVKGSITAKTVEGGVEFQVKFENLPAEGGPFGKLISPPALFCSDAGRLTFPWTTRITEPSPRRSEVC